jgi:hypothetical protein
MNAKIAAISISSRGVNHSVTTRFIESTLGEKGNTRRVELPQRRVEALFSGSDACPTPYSPRRGEGQISSDVV